MKRLLSSFWSLLVEEEGASATEYAVLIVLIILVAISAVAFLGQQVAGGFNTFVQEFSEAQGS